ncbi:MAG: hypothetical protein WD360_04105 [Nitriliruptoraceae bacterium]
MRIRSAQFAAALLALMLIVSACAAEDDSTQEPGGDDQSPTVPGDTEPAPEPEPKPEPEPDVRSAPAGADDCSASGQSVTVLPAPDLDDTVLAMRDFLIDAALRCDESMLQTAIDESSQFSFSFGGDTDALGYWWDLEEAGDEPFLRLAQVLATTPALAEGGQVVVFPRVTTGRPADTTDEAIDELTWIDEQRRETILGDTGYLDWRAGISLDGEWRFFVRGD